MAPSNISTPTIIIKLVGLSIRNHAVSTLDMRSRWGMETLSENGPGGG